jgi:Na+-translocating ferredoxin:NAD+ oxidoreductase subunit B
MEIIIVILLMAVLGCVFGLILGFFSKKFAVKIDKRIEDVIELLPGSNCGACGYAGCAGLAEAIVNEGAEPSLCAPGGEETAEEIAKYMGITASKKEKQVVKIFCQGSKEKAPLKYEHSGIDDCNEVIMFHGGPKLCEYGCLALLSCQKACPFDAIYIKKDGLPVVDKEKCVACKKCIDVCPKNLIALVPKKSKVHILCCSHDKGAVTNKNCKVGCIACQKCIKECPVDAIYMEDNLAKINYEKCISCGKCVKICPKGVIENEKVKKSI